MEVKQVAVNQIPSPRAITVDPMTMWRNKPIATIVDTARLFIVSLSPRYAQNREPNTSEANNRFQSVSIVPNNIPLGNIVMITANALNSGSLLAVANAYAGLCMLEKLPLSKTEANLERETNSTTALEESISSKGQDTSDTNGAAPVITNTTEVHEVLKETGNTTSPTTTTTTQTPEAVHEVPKEAGNTTSPTTTTTTQAPEAVHEVPKEAGNTTSPTTTTTTQAPEEAPEVPKEAGNTTSSTTTTTTQAPEEVPEVPKEAGNTTQASNTTTLKPIVLESRPPAKSQTQNISLNCEIDPQQLHEVLSKPQNTSAHVVSCKISPADVDRLRTMLNHSHVTTEATYNYTNTTTLQAQAAIVAQGVAWPPYVGTFITGVVAFTGGSWLYGYDRQGKRNWELFCMPATNLANASRATWRFVQQQIHQLHGWWTTRNMQQRVDTRGRSAIYTPAQSTGIQMVDIVPQRPPRTTGRRLTTSEPEPTTSGTRRTMDSSSTPPSIASYYSTNQGIPVTSAAAPLKRQMESGLRDMGEYSHDFKIDADDQESESSISL